MRLRQRFSNDGQQLGKSHFHVLSKVHPQGAPAPVSQYLKISSRLCRLDHPEGASLARYWQIVRVVAGDLQKDTGVRTALVCLSGRVQETWTETEAGRNPLRAANGMANLL